MKPEIIFISEQDGLIRLSKEDIISLIDKAYSAGMADASKITTSPCVVHPTSQWVPTWTDKTYITCGADMREPE